jgi:hypothetical protein
MRPTRPGAVAATANEPSRFPGAKPASPQRAVRFPGAKPALEYDPANLSEFIGPAGEGITPEQALQEGHVERYLGFLETKLQTLPLDSNERREMAKVTSGLRTDLAEFNRQTRDAARAGVSRPTLRRMESAVGAFEQSISQRAVGQTAQRAAQGLQDVATAGLSLTDRAAESVGLDTPFSSEALHANKQLREEFLAKAEQGGDIQQVLGERGSNIYNGVVNSVTKFSAAGMAGPAAVYSLIGGESFDSGLEEARQAGFEGGSATAYAGAKAVSELAITALMGQAAKKLGLASLEESMSPAWRAAATRLASTPGLRSELKKTAAAAGGAGLESFEEALVETAQQAVELTAGTSESFDWNRLVDAGAAGAGARGVSSVVQTVRRLAPQKVEDTVAGTVAAERAAQRGVDLAAIRDNLSQKAFAAYTGIKKTSKVFREAFADAVGVNTRTPQNAEAPAPQPSQDATEAAPAVSESPNAEKQQEAAEGLTEPTPTAEGENAAPAGPPTAQIEQLVRSAEDVAGRAFRAARSTVDQARAQLELPEIGDAARRTWQTELDTAKQNRVPDRALAIANDLIVNPRSLSPVETAGVAIRASETKQRYESLAKQITGTDNETDLRMLAEEQTRAQEEFDMLSQALRLSGTEKGRALASQKLTIDQDFSLLSIRSRVKAAAGKKLTPQQEQQTAEIKEEIDAAQAAAEKHRPKLDAARKRREKNSTPETEKAFDETQKEQDKLDFQLHKKRRKVTEMIRRVRPKTVWKGAIEAQDFARAIMTSFDFSGMLRQGGLVVFANPKLGIDAARVMFKAARSEQDMFEIMREIERRPNAELYAKADLFLHETEGSASEREETFASKLAEKLPGVGGSQRAYVTFLNRLRADAFDMFTATLARNGEPTLEEAQAIANFVNVATGRGNAGSWSPAMQKFSTVFFAPRYVLSRFQTLIGQPLWDGNDRTRKLIAREYAKYAIGMAGVYALATLAWGEEEDFSLTGDPRSADFGKIRLGNTRLDPLSGFAQTARIVAQLASGQTMNRHGEVRDLRGPNAQFGANLYDTATRFGRTKLAPGPGVLVNAVVGENVVGDEFDAGQTALDLFFPLSFRDMAKAIEEQGVSRGTALSIMSLFGVGLMSYDSDS